MTAISRRKALAKAALATMSLALGSNITLGQNRQLRILIRNGLAFIDGRLKLVNIGIDRNATLRLLTGDADADEVIDAHGLIVAPGFIDILGDNGSQQLQTYRTFEKYKLTDGVTTVLQLHGGAASPAQYHLSMDSRPHLVNYGVGVFVMMIRNQVTTLSARLKKVEQGLEEGGLAVCHSIEYQPTPYEELREYAKLARKFNRPMFLHLRYSSEEKELDGVQEAVKLARESGAHVHIDHLHSTGGTFQMEKALDLIEEGRRSGLSITCCVYPYSYWATYLISKRFDPGWQKRFNLTYDDLTIVGTGERITAQNFQRYRQQPGLLVATPEGTMPLEKTVKLALQRDFCLVGSDGGILKEAQANNHPRGAGCFATALRYGIDSGIGLETVLNKLTRQPAELISPALRNRGVLANGAIADLTIFNAKDIRGAATVANPNQFSEGFTRVFVGGELSCANGELRSVNNGVPISYS
ncbi:MAG: nitrate reductase [Cyclobacteriaceae bacterium]|jgi:N-acyl-D-aspartate/D-glutamate deacylase